MDRAVGEFHSLDSYARYCAGMLRFREPLEAALRAADPAREWCSVEIAAALRSDLADLGRPAEAVEGIAAPELEERPFRWGVLYVLEGSALGAVLLLKRAVDLGLSGSSGARHLALQTHDRKRWLRFTEMLDLQARDNPEAAERGAAFAFALALNSFSNGEK